MWKKHLHHLWTCQPRCPTSAAYVLIWLFMNHSSAMHVENKSDACTHIVHICVSESSSLGCRVANRMLSSVFPAGGHALSITAKYRHLLSEGLEDLGCPNQSPDLNPCRAIKLKQFRVMEASKLLLCHRVADVDLSCSWSHVIGTWMLSFPENWGLPLDGCNNSGNYVSWCWTWSCAHLAEGADGDFNMQMWFWDSQMKSERRVKAHNYEHKRHSVDLVWSCVCVYVSMHAALQHRCPSPAFDCKRWASRHFYELGTSNTSLSSFYHFPEHSAHVTPC